MTCFVISCLDNSTARWAILQEDLQKNLSKRRSLYFRLRLVQLNSFVAPVTVSLPSPPLPLRPFPITSCPSPAYSICVAAFLLHRTCQFALGEGIGGKGVSKTQRMYETIVAWLYITHCESIVRLCRCFKGKPNCNFLARSRLLNNIDNFKSCMKIAISIHNSIV